MPSLTAAAVPLPANPAGRCPDFDPSGWMCRLARRLVIALLWTGLLTSSAWADDLQTIQARGKLIWGADQEGGGPFVYPDPEDATRLRGFEVEVAALLAEKLGVQAEFSQGEWDKLPDLLERGDVDIVLNGYEWSAERADRFGVSIPYYLYELQLLGRVDDNTLSGWQDLRRSATGAKRRVAVLGGSAAHDYLVEQFPADVEPVLFTGATDALRAVELHVDGIDANLQDGPVATFYHDGFPGLRTVGEPVGLGYYVILTRPGETRLLEQLNSAIRVALQDGSLRKVLERYRMWNATQARRGLELGADGNFRPTATRPPAENTEDAAAPTPDVAPQEFLAVRGWAVVWQRGWLLVKASGMTILLSVVSMPLAILVGLSIALVRLYGPRWLAWCGALYVEVVRGTPLVLQLYVIFFLLPEYGISIPAFWSAVIGLAVNYSAYEAEIYRAGLLAIPRGQMEAALSLGMSRNLALRRVIVPQAVRLVIPPVTNDFIALFKDTAVCSVITVVELSKQYYIHARSTGAVVELGLLTAALYLAMSYPLSVWTSYLERRQSSGGK